MNYNFKGNGALQRGERQSGNSNWWTHQTMSYDWKQPIAAEKFTQPWFDASDERFLFAARLFTGKANPFAELMDLANLAGKRVLEIGCGMGYHSELLAGAGASLTSVDISPTSVEATRRRLALRGLSADVQLLDAEQLKEKFDPAEFDLIWSWGVIHHSAHTARIVRQLGALVKQSGKVKLMVYHLGGMSAYYTVMRRYAVGFWLGRQLDDLLWTDADGFTARFYTRDSLSDMMLAFFGKVDVRVFGQDADVVMLPRQIRKPFLKMLSNRRQIGLASTRGSMLYVEAEQPF